MTLALPGDDHDPADGGAGAEVDHEDGLVHVVVVHDRTVGEVRVLLTVHCQRAVSILPLLPRVPLVVHPGLAKVRLVRNWNKEWLKTKLQQRGVQTHHIQPSG